MNWTGIIILLALVSAVIGGLCVYLNGIVRAAMQKTIEDECREKRGDYYGNKKNGVTLLIILLSVSAPLRLSAVVPPFQNVTLTWDAPSATNQILGYRFYLIDGVTGATNYVGQSVTNRFTLTNVTATPQRWFVTTTNAGRESDPCFMEPFKPDPPTDLRPVSTTLMGVPLPGTIEGSTDLATWDTRLRLSAPASNTITLTHTLRPAEPLMFWRARSITAVTPPPLPQ